MGYVKYSDLVQNKPLNFVQTDFSKIGKVTTESVFKATRKNWVQWISILDQAGARSWKYREIAAYLKSKYRLKPWWQHGVTLGFEIAIGRRKEGQDAKGKYMVTATKSLAADAKDVWKFIVSPVGQKIWLNGFSSIDVEPGAQFETKDGFFGEVRTVAEGRRVRLFWQDPEWSKHTVVELLLVPRPAGKSILVINHTVIVETRTRDFFRKRWRSAADQIAEWLSKADRNFRSSRL